MSNHSSRGAAWQRLRREVLERDNWTCQYCGNDLHEDDPRPEHDATADHINPKAAGGRDERSNLLAACRRCNGIKSDKTMIRVDWLNPDWLAGAA
ncbi:5-methylcytosine-specific restriction endonuclease McrA [Microbacterium sp. ZKA21]|uniref:HNH endonuclease n=1 Tax=Microbacterium sp. ZKA21 TaxID=3381694 RepID=UPI003D245BB3